MGKATGNMEYNRNNNPALPVSDRIKNFNDFHNQLPEAERQKQGARCMNCGVPFCQSGMEIDGSSTGCPLHNLIPEWNDEIFAGNWEHALERLLKSNNFPEFTGRVCPAPCESACTCKLVNSPVTIRENELSIIEAAFRQGLIKPHLPDVRSDKKVAIIGSGPAGLACADQLNHRGHNVTVFEKQDRIGGLLMYGIPNMKLDKAVVNRRVKLMSAEGVRFVTDSDIRTAERAAEIIAGFDAVVLCCGAGNPRKLKAEGSDARGVYYAVDFLTAAAKELLDNGCSKAVGKTIGKISAESSATAKDKKMAAENAAAAKCISSNTISAKGKKVIVVGGGNSGNDCIAICIRQGCASLHQLSRRPKNNTVAQWPAFAGDFSDNYAHVEAVAALGYDTRLYQLAVKRLITDNNHQLQAIVVKKLEQRFDNSSGRMILAEIDNSEQTLEADMLLIASGYIGAEQSTANAFGVKLNDKSCVATEKQSYRTNADKIFTAGDMHVGPSFVVRAIAEGRAAAKEVDAFLMGYTNML